jgi:predicted nucleic acid-binding Zn ribbon protein
MNKQLTKRHCSEKCRKKHERKRWREGNKEVKLFGTRIGFHIEMISKYPELYR